MGCGVHVARDVRFNARKEQVGFFHSTPILDFRMQCRQCGLVFRIRADPETSEYICMEGIRRKTETFTAEDNQSIRLADREEREMLLANPFARLEHRLQDEQKRQRALPGVEALREARAGLLGDDFANNARARQLMRQRRRADKTRDAVYERLSLDAKQFSLLPATPADTLKAMQAFDQRPRETTETGNLAKKLRKKALKNKITRA